MKTKIATILAFTLLLSNIPVFTAHAQTYTVPSAFEVQEVSSYMVKLPEQLNLKYNTTQFAYIASDYISIEGDLSDNEVIKVSSNTEISYTNETDGNVLVGTVTFGNEDGIAYWSQEDIDNGKKVKIKIKVDANQKLTLGNYSCDLDFNIETTNLLPDLNANEEETISEIAAAIDENSIVSTVDDENNTDLTVIEENNEDSTVIEETNTDLPTIKENNTNDNADISENTAEETTQTEEETVNNSSETTDSEE